MVGAGYDDTDVQDVISLACQKARKRKKPAPSGKWQCLQERLLDCYVESCEGAPKDKRFCHGVRLLEKIVHQDNLSTLVVNLYAGNEGYSLMLKGTNGVESETVKLPYEESEFLDYLDAQELPPILVDLLDKAQANVFYSGCVVVEVRDYRQGQTTSSYESNYVLLQPTYQSLVCDVNSLTSDSSKWTLDEKLKLESKLLLATEAPLCLDPSLKVLQVANQLQFNHRKWNTHGIKRSIRQHSHASHSRSMAMSTRPAPSELQLLDFLSHYKKSQPPVNLRLAKTPQTTDIWRQKPLQLATPQRVDVDLYAKMIERPKMVQDNTPESVQEITLEGEKTNNRNYFCKVTIRRRPTDLQYLGELYLEEDTSTSQNSAGSTGSNEEAGKGGRACKFSLGSKLNAQKYLQQFQDLYTEEGRKSVKICTYIPQGNQVSQTPTQTSTTSTAEIPADTTAKGQPARTNGTTAVVGTPVATKTQLLAAQTGVAQNITSTQAVPVPRNVKASPLPATWTYGQKLAMLQQQQKLQGVLPTSSAQFVVTSSTGVSGVPLKAVTRSISTGAVTQYISTSQTSSSKQVLSPTKTSVAASTGRRPVLGSGGVNVSVPAGMTVAVPGATTGTTQFITTGLKTTTKPRQAATGAPLALLQTAQVTQGRAPGTTFTLPGNLVQIPSGTLNTQIQPKTSSQGVPTGQPTHILPNTAIPPQSGLTTVTLNARPILPQQQQRKINPVNRTPNLQPMVSLGAGQIPQQQLQFRMVHLNQPPGQTQIQQQTMMHPQVGAVQAVQIHAGQVIPSQSGTVVQQVHVHTKPVLQTRPGQQVQSPHTAGRTPTKSPARRRSQNK